MSKTTNALPDTPRIRYTIGPDELGFGPHSLKKGEWCGPVSMQLAEEATREGRVKEYGFEQVGYVPPPAAAPADESPAPAPAPGFTYIDPQE